ncbi:conserved hypothetical protein [Vibrio nigripulchritudo SOn1]|uniref:Phage protein n=1 Tax=Vibrio nigripulchritudo SOn1 TaxID=1238450 RepID=A0AAV2VPK7_9VIBR|nr:hypothetical protein [Vibrio nigripulchritudo]CCO46661.1 conserved hypothetical protein [Vibrio nigripulchritudo SOn1]
MEVNVSTAVKLTLTNLERLDPITVYLEEFSPKEGRIVIHCWGKAWAAFWPAMGDRGIAQFFIDCDNPYLAKNLDSELKAEIHDYEALHTLLLNKVTKKLSSDDLSEDEQQYFASVKSALNRVKDSFHDDREGEFWCHENSEYLYELVGDCWWDEIPKKPNHEYEYLCRIIDVVRSGLKDYVSRANKTATVA